MRKVGGGEYRETRECTNKKSIERVKNLTLQCAHHTLLGRLEPCPTEHDDANLGAADVFALTVDAERLEFLQGTGMPTCLQVSTALKGIKLKSVETCR